MHPDYCEEAATEIGQVAKKLKKEMFEDA